MIVKDEEKFLAGCLESVKRYVDEIVVVDTGSTDRSIDIAKQFGARVFTHPWERDFAKHRNQSLDYAKGDWLLILDADEQLVPPSGETLLRAIQDPAADSIAVQVINPFNEGKNCAVFNSVRIFKRGAGIRYEGKVHNREVGCSHTTFYPIQILHQGYSLNEEKLRKKFARTTELLKEQIDREPEEPLAHHYLSASYMSMAVYDRAYLRRALEEGEAAIRLSKLQQKREEIYLCTYYIAAACHLNLGRWRESEKICQDALTIHPEHLDSYYLLTKIHDRFGRAHETKRFATRYLETRAKIERCPENFGKIINNSYWGRSVIQIMLAKAEHALGNTETAKALLEEVARLEPGNPDLLKMIGESYFRTGSHRDAIPYLAEAGRRKKDKITLFMLAESYGQIGDIAKQIEVFGEITKLFPEDTETLRQIGLVQFERGNHRMARSCFETLIRQRKATPAILSKLEASNTFIQERERHCIKHAGSKPRLSACLIVKDEEECIDRCLTSVTPFVDEVVVVDTGSTDRTVEIALKSGARVYHHPWEGNFSKHRNQSLAYATGDWMLIIDADEALETLSAESIRPVVAKTDKNAVLFKVLNLSSRWEPRSIFINPRLFRNGIGVYYEGTVHNQPCFPGGPEPSNLKILHYGYDLEPERMKAKGERTIGLLEREIARDPSAVFPRFNLAISKFIINDHTGSIAEAEKVIHGLEKHRISNPAYATIFYILAAAHFHLGHLQQAEQAASEGVAYAPKSLDCHFVLSAVNDRKGRYPKAVEYGERYLELYREIQESPARDLFDHKTIGDRWRLLLTLSFASAKLDRLEDARAYCEEALEAASFQTFPLTERIKFCTKIGLYDIALKHCHQISVRPQRLFAEGTVRE